MKTTKKNEDDLNNIDKLSKPEIEFDEMEEMFMALFMHTCGEKTFLGKDD